MSAPATRFFIYVAVTLAITVMLNILKPKQVPQPRGILLPLINAHAPQNHITLYDEKPQDGTILGVIHVQYHTKKSSKMATTDMLTFAKQLGKSYGANGLVIKTLGKVNNPHYATLSHYVLTANAINKG